MDLVIFMNDRVGGVASMAKNLLEYISNSEDSLTINTTLVTYKEEKDSSPLATQLDTFLCQNCVRFNYNILENKYYLAQRISRKINLKDDQVILANDGFELRMIEMLQLNSRLAFILHGDYDYYYQLANRYEGIIDLFIGVSQHISDSLKKYLPVRSDDIIHLPLPLHLPSPKKEFDKEKKSPLKLLFVGRMTRNKGFFDLPIIDRKLEEKGIPVKWCIVAPDGKKEDLNSIWPKSPHVHFLPGVPHKKLLHLYQEFDLFLLPSRAEGLPWTLIEAMAAGVVPLINSVNPGISEIVTYGQNGFVFELGENQNDYVNIISDLNKNREKLIQVSTAASNFARTTFNFNNNANNYLCHLKEIIPAAKSFHIMKNNFLDSSFVPAMVTILVRKYLKKREFKQNKKIPS